MAWTANSLATLRCFATTYTSSVITKSSECGLCSAVLTAVRTACRSEYCMQYSSSRVLGFGSPVMRDAVQCSEPMLLLLVDLLSGSRPRRASRRSKVK